MNPYVKSFRLAFSSISGVLGLVAATISLISLFVRLFSIDVSQIFGRIITAYRQFAHFFVDYIFGWMAIQFEPWHKDVICLWVIIGGVTFRMLQHIFLERRGTKQYDGYVGVVHNAIIAWLVEKRWRHFLLAPLCLVCWPLIAYRVFREPMACQTPNVPSDDSVVVFCEELYSDWTLLYDIRIIFFFQLGAVLCAVAAFVAVNGYLNI